MNRARETGVTLLELLIGLSISASLLMMAVPSFGEWLSNARIRAATESMLDGIQLARAEAIKRNQYVRFQLTSTTSNSCALAAGGNNWVVSLDDPSGACASTPSDTSSPRIIQVRPGQEGTGTVAVAGSSGSSTAHSIRFNGLGQLVGASSGFRLQMSLPSGGNCSSAGGELRCLQVSVSSAGQVRMCDPVRPSGDPEAC